MAGLSQFTISKFTNIKNCGY